MNDIQLVPTPEGPIKLVGTIRKLKVTRASASFVFTSRDRNAMGMVAIAAAAAGLGGQAMATASHAGNTEEDADYLEFDLDGKAVKGWVWRDPEFREGDFVEVAAQYTEDHWEAYAIARPSDGIIALYPHCSRGRMSHYLNAVKWWLLGGGAFVALALIPLAGPFIDGKLNDSPEVLWIALGFWAFLGLMTASLTSQWRPFASVAENVFRALELPHPSYVDLVKTTKRLRTKFDPGELGAFFFKYAQPKDPDTAKDPILSFEGRIEDLSSQLSFDVDLYLCVQESRPRTKSQSTLVQRASLPEVVTPADMPGYEDEAQATGPSHCDAVVFRLDERWFAGKLWRNPFVEGDEVIVAAEKAGARYRILGVARPRDRMIALHPFCTASTAGSPLPAIKFVVKLGLAIIAVLGVLAAFIVQASALSTVLAVVFAVVFGLCALFYYFFIHRDHRVPIANHNTRVFKALKVPNPSGVDLIASSARQRTGDEPPEYGVYYFRY